MSCPRLIAILYPPACSRDSLDINSFFITSQQELVVPKSILRNFMQVKRGGPRVRVAIGKYDVNHWFKVDRPSILHFPKMVKDGQFHFVPTIVSMDVS
jgi:hypothetical protein